MKAEILELALPVAARLERFAFHQLPLLLAWLLLLLLCEDELEPKPLRDTCAVPMARLPGRASLVAPSLSELRLLP
jgi:hypothetical protein